MVTGPAETKVGEYGLVFITECAIHLASQLAGKFAFLTHNQAILKKMERMARGYGLGQRMVEGASLDLTY